MTNSSLFRTFAIGSIVFSSWFLVSGLWFNQKLRTRNPKPATINQKLIFIYLLINAPDIPNPWGLSQILNMLPE